MRSIKILLTGGGTGGHICPLLAVAQELKRIVGREIELIYIGPPSPFNSELERAEIPVYTLLGAKLRRYADIQNLFDIPKFFLSLLQALYRLYVLMPNVVFSKGGPGALAVVFAAKFYFIPVIIHESDAAPGLTNQISSHLAKRVGIAFGGAADYFPDKKTAFVGNPVRPGLLWGLPEQGKAKTQLGFDPGEPLLFIIGGSQGAQRINDFIFDNLEPLLLEYQVYHQVGPANLAEAKSFFDIFSKEQTKEVVSRYRFAGYLDLAELKLAFSAADLVISRAGAGTIYEIAAFGKPAVLIPLEGAANDHQRANAFEYSKTGTAVVIEENNLKIHILLVQIKNILGDPPNLKYMKEKARAFFKPAAAEEIAKEILRLGKWRAK